METDLHISKRLKAILPPLTEEERTQLEANIKADGRLTDAILYWHDGERNVVIDGMHRWQIVKGTDIPYTTRKLDFEDYTAAEIWILDHQLGRRNLLEPSAIRTLRGELYNRIKAQRGGDHKSEKSNGQNVPLIGDAAEIVAEKAGVSERTVRRDGARVAAIEGLTKAAQVVAKELSDKEITTLAKLTDDQQDRVARLIRTKSAAGVGDALSKAKIKVPTPRGAASIKVVEGDEPDPADTARKEIGGWAETVGRFLGRAPSVDDYRRQFPGAKADAALEAVKACYEALKAWQKAIK